MIDSSVHQHRYKIFTVGAIGTFMATLDGSILNVALPTIADEFHASIGLVAWVILAYSLTLISLMMVFGAWTESKGYRFAYRFGYMFFMAGSALCALSPGIYLLIAARVIQATGTAMFAALGPGMVTTVFPPEERGKSIGMMVMMVSAGFMIGPPLGGVLLEYFSWPAIFLINLPIGLFGLYYINRYFAVLTPPNRRRPIPIPAAVALSVALVGGIYGLTLLKDRGLSDPRIWIIFCISGLLLAFFIRSEARPRDTLIGLEIFRNRQFTASLAAQAMHFVAAAGVLVLVPFYLERVQGLEPRQVWMYLVILPIMMFILAPLAGRLSDRIGVRLLTTLGMLMLGSGMYYFAQLDIGSDTTHVIWSLVIIGGGIGVFSTPNSSAMMGSVRTEQRAVASGILATNRNIGTSAGIALGTALFSYFQVQNAGLGADNLIFVASYRPVMYAGVAAAAIGIIFCLIRSNRSPAPEVAAVPEQRG